MIGGEFAEGFGRRAAGVRTVSTPMIGAFTSGVKKPKAASTTIAAPHGSGTASSHSGSGNCFVVD